MTWESQGVIFDPKSIIDLNQFEGTIWAKYNTMEQTCKNYDFGLRDEEILKKKTDKTETSGGDDDEDDDGDDEGGRG